MLEYIFRGGLGNCKYFARRIVLLIVNSLALDPGFRPLQDIRILLLTLIGTKIGHTSQLSEDFFILYGRNFSAQEGARIGTHCKIYDFSPIKIGKFLLASHGLTLISGTHNPETYKDIPGPITIGDDVWIGINVTIIGPVAIGDGAVIGAGALVIKDIPKNAIVGGVPAKIIRIKNV